MEPNAALEKLRAICSRQEKSPADIMACLKRWEVEKGNHQAILEKLKSEKFVDERRYASAFVRDKIKFDHWGLIKIRIMLGQKGIDKTITDNVIKEVDREAYRRMIGSELDKKRKSLKGTPYEIWAKLARYGSSRGYEMEYMEEFLGDTPG